MSYDRARDDQDHATGTRTIRVARPVSGRLARHRRVAILLTLPIHTRGPGDHELKRCGNALALDLELWRFVPDGGDAYFEPAFRHCTAQRVDRIALAVGVLAVTMLVAAFVAGRRPGRSESVGPVRR